VILNKEADRNVFALITGYMYKCIVNCQPAVVHTTSEAYFFLTSTDLYSTDT